MNQNTALQIVANRVLPALSGCPLTYVEEKNLFLTPGYTSSAGNTYFKTLRVTDHLVVVCEVGKGYAYTFLNAITLYCWDGNKKTLIGRRVWGGCNWVCYSERFVREQSIIILRDYLKAEMKLAGQYANDDDINDFARQIVIAGEPKQLR